MAVNTNDISLYGNNIEPSLTIDLTLLATYGWLHFQPVTAGSIGAFYFGPIPNKTVIIDSPVNANFIAFTPTILTTMNSVTPTPAMAYYSIQPPTIINTSDIIVDFIGVPRIGISPLIVDFTALVTLGGGANGTYLADEYHWYFDYVNNPLIYETSITPFITHVYSGYYGQKFSVKLCVILK